MNIVSLSLKWLQCPRFQFWVTFVETLGPIFARESDLIIDRRMLERGEPATEDLSRQVSKKFDHNKLTESCFVWNVVS
jgi:hypothetical protein